MNRAVLRSWHAAQPYLTTPRRWSAILWRKLLWRTTLVAISGSNGKTTATRLLQRVLAAQGPTRSTSKNRNGFEGITEAIAFSKPWKTRFAIFEVAAGKANAIHQAMQIIRPDISVILSVFLEHRSYFKTIEAVAREKSLLLTELSENGVAVINASDPLVADMPLPPGRKVIRFGASDDCDNYFENAVSAWPQLLRFTAVVGGQRQEIETRLLGLHWTGPVMACVSVAHYLGVPLATIAGVIREVGPYPARMQVVELPSGATVIRDEFKASEHTVAAAFEEMRKASATRKTLVFCDLAESSLSPRDRLGRIGKRVARIFDRALFIGTDSHHALRGCRSAGLSAEQVLAFPDFRAASDFLKPLLGPGDLVLLKAQRNHQLDRLFYSLLGEVGCVVPACGLRILCDDCPELGNPEMVRMVEEQLTVRVS